MIRLMFYRKATRKERERQGSGTPQDLGLNYNCMTSHLSRYRKYPGGDKEWE